MTDVFNELEPPYATIVADPPWDYPEGFSTQPRSPAREWSGPIDHAKALPYSSMPVTAIAALPVGSLATTDARLFLWATNRYLPAALAVADAWGFAYRQALVWHKLDGNMGGSVAPNSAEFLLVCTRGKPRRLSKLASAVVPHAQAKQHSKKPDVFLDLVEQVSPGPYVELFCRRPRLGWDSWGKGYELGGAA